MKKICVKGNSELNGKRRGNGKMIVYVFVILNKSLVKQTEYKFQILKWKKMIYFLGLQLLLFLSFKQLLFLPMDFALLVYDLLR